MDDAYRALCVATHRPMRQWWRRVGSWWIAGLVVLLGAQVWTTVYEYHWAQQLAQRTVIPRPLVYDIIGTLHYIVIPLASLLWLQAAWKASDLTTRLASESASVGEGELSFLRFRLALSQGTVPVIAISLFTVLSEVMYGPWGIGDPLDLANVLVWPGALARMFCSIIFMLWMFLFLAYIQIKHWFVVTWCLVMHCIPWLLNFILFLCIHLSFNLPLSSGAAIVLELDSQQRAFIWLCALAYFYSIPWLLAQHRTRLAVWLVAAYLVIAPLSYLTIAPRSIVFSLIRAIGDIMPSAVVPISVGTSSYSIKGSGFEAICDVHTYIRPFDWNTTFQLPVALSFLTLIVPIAIFAAHYYALRWIMLNVKPAAPKQKQPGPV